MADDCPYIILEALIEHAVCLIKDEIGYAEQH